MQNINENLATETLVKDLLKEKRADRRWKNIRFIAWFALFAYVFISLIHYSGEPSGLSTSKNNKYVSLVRLDGMIAPGRDFSAEEATPILQKAFADKNAVGVVLDIDSPGGTPVQASIIHDEILYLKNKYHKKVIVVGEDLLTSGAYFVAVAADNIYVNPNTLTGSVGVIMKGFGFVDLMKKMGVERRVYISGDQKDRLDPFLPQTPEDIEKIKQVMDEVHDNFAAAVLEGRKGKLHADPQVLFSGDFWTGQTAVKLGLVDGVGNLTEVLQKEFNTTEQKDYSDSADFLHKLGGQLGSEFDSLVYAY